MSKQTAIIWFNQQLIERQNGNGDRRSWSEILREALVMEREQIIEAANNGCKGMCMIDTSRDGKQYYNETFNQTFGGQDNE